METNKPGRRSAMQGAGAFLVQTPNKLRHASLAAQLAWAGLMVGVIAPLVFVLAGGPEWVVKISNTAVLWALTWLFVGLVPVGSRVFTPWIGGAIDKVDPHKIVEVQKKRVTTLAPAMYVATILILWDQDLLSQMYINFIILGIATNVAALQEMWRKGLTKAVSKFTTSLVALVVPVAVAGLVLNVCMVFIGSAYKHSMVAWVFEAVPEIVVRPLLPICYEVCFLTSMGIILTRRMHWSWERARLIAGAVVSNIAALLFFIWAGGEIGNILADNYAAASHNGLPQGLVHIIAISVIVRAPAYLVGGLGATWNAAGMNERVKQLLAGWLQFIFGWLKSSLGVTALEAQVKQLREQVAGIEPLQGKVAALEAEMDLLRNELRTTRDIAGLPALESEIAKIEDRFRKGLAKLWARVASSSVDALRLDRLADLLGQPDLAIPQLLEVGKGLKEMEEQLKGLRKKNTRGLRYQRTQARKALEQLSKDVPQFARWLAEVRADLENDATSMQEQLQGGITLLQNRRNRLARLCTMRMRDMSTELRAVAGEQAQRAEVSTQQADELEKAIQAITA